MKSNLFRIVKRALLKRCGSETASRIPWRHSIATRPCEFLNFLFSLARDVRWQLQISSSRTPRRTLSPEELQNVKIWIICDAHQAEFLEDYCALQENKPIPKRSCLIKLTPKIDEDDLIRCDGRLHFEGFLPYDMRFPTIYKGGFHLLWKSLDLFVV